MSKNGRDKIKAIAQQEAARHAQKAEATLSGKISESIIRQEASRGVPTAIEEPKIITQNKNVNVAGKQSINQQSTGNLSQSQSLPPTVPQTGPPPPIEKTKKKRKKKLNEDDVDELISSQIEEDINETKEEKPAELAGVVAPIIKYLPISAPSISESLVKFIREDDGTISVKGCGDGLNLKGEIIKIESSLTNGPSDGFTLGPSATISIYSKTGIPSLKLTSGTTKNLEFSADFRAKTGRINASSLETLFIDSPNVEITTDLTVKGKTLLGQTNSTTTNTKELIVTGQYKMLGLECKQEIKEEKTIETLKITSDIEISGATKFTTNGLIINKNIAAVNVNLALLQNLDVEKQYYLIFSTADPRGILALDGFTGGVAGQLLIIQTAPGKKVKIINGGTGLQKIYTKQAGGKLLGFTDGIFEECVQLICDGKNWHEL